MSISASSAPFDISFLRSSGGVAIDLVRPSGRSNGGGLTLGSFFLFHKYFAPAFMNRSASGAGWGSSSCTQLSN
ncbi:hypothetical protein FF1_013986 [Malus domestica]